MRVQAIRVKAPDSFWPMLIIGGLFFIFGFITWLNGALVPFLQIVCDLNEVEAITIASTFYFAAFVMALPMAKVLESTGYKKAMSIGLSIIAIGALFFIPAAKSQSFLVFLLAQFILGTGLTLLQTASNPYIVKIGPQVTAAVRISIMGILNKMAGVIAPVVFTALVIGEFSHVNIQYIDGLSNASREAEIAQLASGLIEPYFWMALALIIMAIALIKSELPELISADEKENQHQQGDKKLTDYPHLVLGAISLFIYVGIEVIAGDTIGLLGSKLGIANATSLTSYTMAFMVIGYISGLIVIPRAMTERQALMGSALIGAVLTLLIVFASTSSTVISHILWVWAGLPELPDVIVYIALLGFANAIVWPAIWPLALNGLGSLTAKGSALLIMGIAGGAILPLIYGFLAEAISSQTAYAMMLPCYLLIFYYAIHGCRLSPKSSQCGGLHESKP
ncbi:sugar MFS transporter [Alteromonas sp. ASW11-130]|uniref:sugar MFS transporter n=1 Tax=Alteromonas sp. ASW11-130 TaxID=3015775 RepID=UPI002242AD3A|nr:sugar MFS transporter [Alteromonas sp. ASW11-130]MCW8092317.1 sugar MFS transporter [Alteromonas sp. ASW11-130]